MNIYTKTISVFFVLLMVSGCITPKAIYNQEIDFKTKAGQQVREGYKQEAKDYFLYAKKQKGELAIFNLDKMEEYLRVGQLSYRDIDATEAKVTHLRTSAYILLAKKYYQVAKGKGNTRGSLSQFEYYRKKAGVSYVTLGTSAEKVAKLWNK